MLHARTPISFAKLISPNIFSAKKKYLRSKNEDTRQAAGIGPRKEKPYANWINKGNLVSSVNVIFGSAHDAIKIHPKKRAAF